MCISPRKSRLRTRPSSPCHTQPVALLLRRLGGQRGCTRGRVPTAADRRRVKKPHSYSAHALAAASSPWNFQLQPGCARLSSLTRQQCECFRKVGNTAESSKAGKQSLALSHRFRSVVEAVTNARRFPAPCFSHEANPIFVAASAAH